MPWRWHSRHRGVNKLLPWKLVPILKGRGWEWPHREGHWYRRQARCWLRKCGRGLRKSGCGPVRNGCSLGRSLTENGCGFWLHRLLGHGRRLCGGCGHQLLSWRGGEWLSLLLEREQVLTGQQACCGRFVRQTDLGNRLAITLERRTQPTH